MEAQRAVGRKVKGDDAYRRASEEKHGRRAGMQPAVRASFEPNDIADVAAVPCARAVSN